MINMGVIIIFMFGRLAASLPCVGKYRIISVPQSLHWWVYPFYQSLSILRPGLNGQKGKEKDEVFNPEWKVNKSRITL